MWLNLAQTIPGTEWEIPWAGIGAFLLGLGGVLSGAAALITARNRGRDEADSTTLPQSSDDRGSGVSDGGSSRSIRTSGPYKDSDD